MTKHTQPTTTYSTIDAQRLKEAFFSIPRKEKLYHHKKKTHKKRRFFIPALIITPIIILIAAAVFLSKYDFVIINRQNTQLENNQLSLLSNTMQPTINFLGNEKFITRKNQGLNFIIPDNKRIGVRLDFEKTLDLKNNYLLFYLKNIDTPVIINVIVKDKWFFSNSLKPAIIKLKADNGKNIKIPLDFGSTAAQNTNLSQIKQLTIYVSTAKKYTKNTEFSDNNNLLLIKNIVLAEKQ